MRTSLLLWTITATLLVETQTQSSFVRWLDRQYEVVRRGFSKGLLRTGSATKRGIVSGSQSNSATRSTSFLNATQQEDRPKGTSLRATSQYFNVSENFVSSTNYSRCRLILGVISHLGDTYNL